MVLDRLVSDTAELRRAWESTPLHSRGLGDFDDVFGLALAEDLIVGRGLRIPYLRLLRDGGYVPASRFTHRTGTGAGQADGVADPHAVLREMERGATVVLRGMVRYCPEVASFCERLSAELGLSTSAGAYLTPPHSRGAGPHYDPMSVLVRQVHGVKHWRLQAPPVQWPRTLPEPGKHYDTPVIAELDLRPGESLYIPRGVVHDAWTTDSASVHITFSGDTPPMWADVLHDLVDQAAAITPALRETFPWRFADAPDTVSTRAKECFAALRAFLDTVDTDALATRIIDRHAALPDPAPRGRLAAALAGTPLSQEPPR
ncbi:JmjC domain-containing protein [Streptomyces sp. CB03234]|uniref:JmjC domain-containing protein n=1 Tax=Streptomyces sp. (strain CB03234) TaxID=1703937 RepID=UPI00093D905F|nr:cupin domain-containing protein [Streptomyces sp. CB03234]